MMLYAYSIYDRKTLAYFPPYFAPTDAAAVRSFSDLATDPQNNVGRHPLDFVLFRIGVYDDQKAELLPERPVAHIIDASALVQSMQHEMPFPDTATVKADLDGKWLKDEVR